MTTKEFRKLFKLREQLDSEKDRINELNAVLILGGSALKDLPNAKAWNKDTLAQTITQLESLRQKYIKLYDAHASQYAEVMAWYDSLPDCDYKSAIYWHYIRGYSWSKTARKCGNNHSPDALRKGSKRLIECEATKI